MVHLSQEVAVVDGIGIEAGADLRTPVAGCNQPGVDRTDDRGGNGDQTALVEVTSFEIGEVEGLVLNDRAAQTCSVLSLRERDSRVRDCVGCVQVGIAEESV